MKEPADRDGRIMLDSEFLYSRSFTCFTCKKEIKLLRRMVVRTCKFYCDYNCCEHSTHDEMNMESQKRYEQKKYLNTWRRRQKHLQKDKQLNLNNIMEELWIGSH